MPDDPKKRGGQDHHRINIAREDEVREWAKKFDASPQQIREAVQAVGDRADDVELHLKGSRSTSMARACIIWSLPCKAQRIAARLRASLRPHALRHQNRRGGQGHRHRDP